METGRLKGRLSLGTSLKLEQERGCTGRKVRIPFGTCVAMLGLLYVRVTALSFAKPAYGSHKCRHAEVHLSGWLTRSTRPSSVPLTPALPRAPPAALPAVRPAPRARSAPPSRPLAVPLVGIPGAAPRRRPAARGAGVRGAAGL